MKRRERVDLIAVYKYLNRGRREEARLFLEVHSGRGNENKLEHGKFLPNTWIFLNFFFNIKMVKY